MGQLTVTASRTRKTIKYGSVVLIALIFVQAGIMYLYNLYKNRAEKPPPPQAAYGVLPPLDFPPPDPGVNFNFRLETISGRLPTHFPDRANVYINAQTTPNLLDSNRAHVMARNLGFTNSGIPFAAPMYRWQIQDTVSGLLESNIYLDTFDMVYDWERNERVFVSPNRIAVTNANIYRAAQRRLGQAGVWNVPWNSKESKFAVLYYRYVNGQLVRVDHESKADFFQVNFQRAPLAGLEVVSADPYRPVAWALVSRSGLQVVELHYNYHPIEESLFTDYPLEPIQTAWQEVSNNQAYIASMGDNTPGNEVIIRHFELAYYTSNQPQKFTQPVYVIRGDRGFTAYVPAVDRRLITPRN